MFVSAAPRVAEGEAWWVTKELNLACTKAQGLQTRSVTRLGVTRKSAIDAPRTAVASARLRPPAFALRATARQVGLRRARFDFGSCAAAPRGAAGEAWLRTSDSNAA